MNNVKTLLSNSPNTFLNILLTVSYIEAFFLSQNVVFIAILKLLQRNAWSRDHDTIFGTRHKNFFKLYRCTYKGKTHMKNNFFLQFN